MNLRKALTDLASECGEILYHAEIQCGGDGDGCAAYRGYFSSPERRRAKCPGCPMDLVGNLRDPLESAREALQRKEGG